MCGRGSREKHRAILKRLLIILYEFARSGAYDEAERPLFGLCRSWIGPKIEFNCSRYLDDALWMAAVLAESISQSLAAADKQAAKGAPSFAGDPVTGPISANENNPWGGATRTGLDRRLILRMME